MSGNPNWKQGGPSPNPGGRTKAQADGARAVAHMILEQTGGGRDLVLFAFALWRCDSTARPGRPDAEQSALRLTLADWGIMPTDVTLEDRKWAFEWLSNRGLGKALQTIDLGGEMAPPPPAELVGKPEDLDVVERVLRETRAKMTGG